MSYSSRAVYAKTSGVFTPRNKDRHIMCTTFLLLLTVGKGMGGERIRVEQKHPIKMLARLGKLCKIYRPILPTNIYEPPTGGPLSEFTLFQGSCYYAAPTKEEADRPSCSIAIYPHAHSYIYILSIYIYIYLRPSTLHSSWGKLPRNKCCILDLIKVFRDRRLSFR